MQYLNIDEARRGLNPRRGKEPSTKYLDNLKESLKEIKDESK